MSHHKDIRTSESVESRYIDNSVLHTNELNGDGVSLLHFNGEVSVNICSRFLSRKFSCDEGTNNRFFRIFEIRIINEYFLGIMTNYILIL